MKNLDSTFVRLWLLVALVLAGSARLAAQATDSAKTRLSISGFVTTSYTYSTHGVGSTIVGRLLGRKQDQFMLNVADLVFERPVATDAYDGGFRVEALFGQNAAVVKSAGLTIGNEGDIWQAYGVLNIPISTDRYIQAKFGKMATLMGLEVIEDVLNPNLDVGAQDIFLEPFTETGFELDAKAGPHFDAELRLSNGWDLVVDNNRGKTAMLRLGITPDDRSSIALLGYFGPEQAGTTDNPRSGGQLLMSRKIGSAANAWLQLDFGQEDGLGVTGGAAQWYAAGLWLTYDLGSRATVGLRGDYVNDRDGVRTSGTLGFPVNTGQKFGSATGTLTIKRWSRVLVRPELRYDRSTLPAFNGGKSQLTVALGTSYLF